MCFSFTTETTNIVFTRNPVVPNYLLLFVILIFVSCVRHDDELITKNEKPKNTRFHELEYTSTNGTMGDSETGILGYGYDITGFIDSTSVRAKVVEELNFGHFVKSNPRMSEWGMGKTGYSYDDFILRLNYIDATTHRTTQKFNFISMFKQAFIMKILI